jgi:hypothetical protein
LSMKRTAIFGLLGLSACRKSIFVLLLSVMGIMTYSQDTTITVISNIKGAPSSMKMAELRSVLKGERQRWSDGTKVSIVLMKTTTAIGKNTCAKIYEMSGDKVKRFWAGLQFAGKVDAPTFCNSVEELESVVAENPGAIGVTDKFTDTPNIKVTMINGKKSF